MADPTHIRVDYEYIHRQRLYWAGYTGGDDAATRFGTIKTLAADLELRHSKPTTPVGHPDRQRILSELREREAALKREEEGLERRRREAASRINTMLLMPAARDYPLPPLPPETDSLETQLGRWARPTEPDNTLGGGRIPPVKRIPSLTPAPGALPPGSPSATGESKNFGHLLGYFLTQYWDISERARKAGEAAERVANAMNGKLRDIIDLYNDFNSEYRRALEETGGIR